MFPTSIDGTFELSHAKETEIESALSKLEQELALASACDIRRRDWKITFRGNAFRFVSNRNIFSIIGAGEIKIDPNTPNQLRYSFSCVEFLTFVTLMTCFVGMYSTHYQPTSILSYAVPVAMWLLFFGSHYLFAKVWLRSFVKRAALA
jgi:hypothetical protein